MSNQKYLYGVKARDAEFRGADIVAQQVIDSIGIFGLNLDLEKGQKTTNDGKLISQSVSLALQDEFERRGALNQHQACERTNDEVADATSTTIALTKGIRDELKTNYLQTERRLIAVKSIAELSKQIDKEYDYVISELEKDVVKITTKEELVNSALVAVEDEKLAKLIGETQWELGEDGRLIPEEVNDTECSVEKIDGILLDNGFATGLNINNPKDHSLTLEKGYILLTNHQIREEHLGWVYDDKQRRYIQTDNAPIANLIKSMAGMGMNNLVIMSQAFTDKALELIANITSSGAFKIYGVNAPYVNQGQMLLDIESVVGGHAILQDSGSLEDVNVGNLGSYAKLKMRIMGGVIVGNGGNKKEERIATLKDELEGEQSFFAKRQLENRIAALEGKLAFLKIGAYVKSDRERLKDKADDAVVSVRMAWKGGTVKGGGQAFHEIAQKMDDKAILKNALSIVYNKIKTSAPEGFVIEDWVRDPFITLKTALKNACECAKSMSRIHGAVVTKDIKPKENDN
jgi:chaperonin GroEL